MRSLAVLCAVVALGGAGLTARAAEPVNRLAAAIASTPAHPRNSEGAFVTLKSGRILFIYSQFMEGTSDFSPCRLAQVHSDDGGRTWSEPVALFATAPGTLEMSASVLRLASGKLALFSAIKHGTLDCRPYLRISTDEGATWSAPRRIVDAPGYFVLNNDRIIQTRTGRLIMPLAFHRGLKSVDDGSHEDLGVDLRGIALWYYSDDDGATWTESESWWTLPGAGFTRTGLQEPGVVELHDGSLLAWARTDRGTQFGFRSTDNGVTWTAPEPLALPSPASPATIKRLPGSPDLLALFNDRTGIAPFRTDLTTWRGRSPLVAALSSDGGVTWRPAKILEEDPARDYAYIGLHFADGAALVSYMNYSATGAMESSHDIRRLDLAWLTAPDDALTARARREVRAILAADETWVKIHAAEALVAGGEAAAIRREFLELSATAAARPYRVGIWRVLANTAPTHAQRLAATGEVAKIFLTPGAPDRSQALETLAKLRAPLDGALADEVRRTAAGSGPLAALARWALRGAGAPDALGPFVALFASADPGEKLVAAYGARLLGESEPRVLRALAAAADAEPGDSRAWVYLQAAAYARDADPARRAVWRGRLESVLATGSVDARFEAAQALAPAATPADLARVAPLLDEAGADTRIGAALVIFRLRYRQ